VVAILKAREPARIMTAIGTAKENRWHLQIAQRWVVQYNFYVNDARWGRGFDRSLAKRRSAPVAWMPPRERERRNGCADP
jgi:hypothetical protein